MSKRTTIIRQTLILNKLKRKPCTFQEISDYLKYESDLQEDNFNISKRTFKRDIDDIASIFQKEIEYDFSEKVYKIQFEDENNTYDKMLEAFDIFNALNLNDKLSRYIFFENRKPKGTEHFNGILHAIKNNNCITFKYKSYFEVESIERCVEPYGLKEFKNRWYLVAKDRKDAIIKTFGLDRMCDIDIKREKFEKPDDLVIKDKFFYSFGITTFDGEKPEEIVLSFRPVDGKYIKSLPLHHTQEIIKEDDQEMRVKLRLHVTYEFLMEVMSYGERVKVIKPKWVAKEIIEKHKKSIEQYKN